KASPVHAGRHTAATTLFHATKNVKAVQGRLGPRRFFSKKPEGILIARCSRSAYWRVVVDGFRSPITLGTGSVGRRKPLSDASINGTAHRYEQPDRAWLHFRSSSSSPIHQTESHRTRDPAAVEL